MAVKGLYWSRCHGLPILLLLVGMTEVEGIQINLSFLLNNKILERASLSKSLQLNTRRGLFAVANEAVQADES